MTGACDRSDESGLTAAVSHIRIRVRFDYDAVFAVSTSLVKAGRIGHCQIGKDLPVEGHAVLGKTGDEPAVGHAVQPAPPH